MTEITNPQQSLSSSYFSMKLFFISLTFRNNQIFLVWNSCVWNWRWATGKWVVVSFGKSPPNWGETRTRLEIFCANRRRLLRSISRQARLIVSLRETLTSKKSSRENALFLLHLSAFRELIHLDPAQTKINFKRNLHLTFSKANLAAHVTYFQKSF